jgi:hypothetical protein
MALKGTRDRYGTLAVAICWLTVMRRQMLKKSAKSGICQYPTAPTPRVLTLLYRYSPLFSNHCLRSGHAVNLPMGVD